MITGMRPVVNEPVALITVGRCPVVNAPVLCRITGRLFFDSATDDAEAGRCSVVRGEDEKTVPGVEIGLVKPVKPGICSLAEASCNGAFRSASNSLDNIHPYLCPVIVQHRNIYNDETFHDHNIDIT
jgi:hypothetical protein